MEIRLKDPSKRNISINLSSDLMKQINKILEMKEHIESSSNFLITFDQVPKDSKNDNNSNVDDLFANSQSINSQNSSNSNNEILKYSDDENYIDLTGEFNIDKKVIETNQIEASSLMSTNFELSESAFGFFDDDADIISTEDDLIWSMETDTSLMNFPVFDLSMPYS